MGRKSITKGSSFERKIAKILSDWSGIKLVRTPMSGAWVGCEADIWPVDPTKPFHLAVECKCSQSWDFHQIMKGEGQFFGWLEQTVSQATGRIPFLVFTANYKPTYVCIPAAHYIECESVLHMHKSVGEYSQFVVMLLSVFMERITYADFVHGYEADLLDSSGAARGSPLEATVACENHSKSVAK